jgi:hypothetical protein
MIQTSASGYGVSISIMAQLDVNQIQHFPVACIKVRIISVDADMFLHLNSYL